MKIGAAILRLLARGLGTGRTAHGDGAKRVLVIRRNRMGDMICTLPLLYALRRAFPEAHLAVACDARGLPIAQVCPAVNEAILLQGGWNRWLAVIGNARRLRGYDLVIAAKVGFDRRLATLARLTDAPRRIGYENAETSSYYTHPVPIPPALEATHQIEATLGLLTPLGMAATFDASTDLRLALPPTALAFADSVLADGPLAGVEKLALFNLSSTTRLKFCDEDFAALAAELAARPQLGVGLVGLPGDRERARAMAARAGKRCAAIFTPGPLELAAVLQRAAVLLTGEGGAAHLAGAVGTPAVVLWSEGPFAKWHSRAANHVVLRLKPGAEAFSRERVRAALGEVVSP